MQKISLDGFWKMSRVGYNESLAANVPTTMYEVLFENDVIEDPFYGENDQLYRDLSLDDCVFTKTFEVDPGLLELEVVEIEFLGLDTLATIKLNGRVLAVTNNMHRTYRYEIKGMLKSGTNNLEVHFASPMRYIAEEQAKDPLWGVTSTIQGYGHLRKAHHMFGWDWGPQLPDMGIWRSVTIYGYEVGKIEEVQVLQHHLPDSVRLDILAEVDFYDEGVQLHYSLTDMDGEIIGQALVSEVESSDVISLRVDNPKLWWPNGYGEQYLYTLTVSLLFDEGVVHEDVKHIGLRTMTMHREKDPWGETFDFNINGVRIFAMGADYIPEDTLITRPTYETTERLIKDCAKANYNCLRVWGGGLYPSDSFYELCDHYGLIVWQDFMFACGVYRLTKKFQNNITAEFIDNIKRIRHHASLGLWCGNNEMEWGFVEWAIPKDERLRMDYLLMYEKLIPDVLADYDPQTFYWPASPSSGGGFLGPNDDNKGDVHYWKVFHGNEHYKKFREHYFRFASEYGMQAFPDLKTIDSFLPKDQYNAFSPVMENHNKCTDPINGNVKVLLNMVQEFRLPKNLEDQVYISQVFQAETIRCAVEHFRRNRGRCMGSTYWQVNDNYPVTSWASIDFYGRWKAMHYLAKRFYSQVLVSAYEEGNIGHIHVTNDRVADFDGTVCWQLCHVEDGILDHGEVGVIVPALSASHVLDVSIEPYLSAYGDERCLYLAYELNEATSTLAKESLLFVCHKAFNFNKASVTIRVDDGSDGLEVTLSSDAFAKAVGLQTKTLDLIFSDNYVDLMPGETRVIAVDEVRSDVVLTKEMLTEELYVQSVNNVIYQ